MCEICSARYKNSPSHIKIIPWNYGFQKHYSVPSLEATIFREIISLVRVNFRSTFLVSYLTPYLTLLWGAIHILYCPHKSFQLWNQWGTEKSKIPVLSRLIISALSSSSSFTNVDLKFFSFLEKIVVFRVETL